MYNSIVMVLCIPEIDDFTTFWAITVISTDTAWKNIAICSDDTNSGNLAGWLFIVPFPSNEVINFFKSLKNGLPSCSA